MRHPHQHAGLEWEPYFREIERIFDSYGGRPHWGKHHFQTAETLAPRYPDWQQFAQIDGPGVAAVMRQPAWLFVARAKADAAAARATGLQVWTVGEGSPA